MKRPYLVNFSAIVSDHKIFIMANITDSETSILKRNSKKQSSSPIQSIKLFSKNTFRVKIQGLNTEKQIIFDKDYDTDDYGKLELQIAQEVNDHKIKNLILYEVNYFSGVQVHLGSILPIEIKELKKITITDFDKT